jgi:hypothetical protein
MICNKYRGKNTGPQCVNSISLIGYDNLQYFLQMFYNKASSALRHFQFMKTVRFLQHIRIPDMHYSCIQTVLISKTTPPPQTLETYRHTYGGEGGGFITWHSITLLEVSPHTPSRAANKLQAFLLASICELWVLFVPTPHYVDCSYIKPPQAFKVTSLCLQTNSS